MSRKQAHPLILMVLLGCQAVTVQASPFPGGAPKGFPQNAAPPADSALLQFLDRSRGRSTGQASTQAEPFFVLQGPVVDPALWSDANAARRTLLVEGEMMIEMGKVLVRTAESLSKPEQRISEVERVSETVSNQRVGSRLAQFLRNGEAGPAASVAVLILTAEDWTEAATERLKAAGLEINSVAGRIISGSIAVSKVRELTELPGIQYLDLSSTFQLSPPPIKATPVEP
jgi:hypothetical protein